MHNHNCPFDVRLQRIVLRMLPALACILAIPSQAMRARSEAGLELFKGGSTALSIVVAAQATPAEKDSAAELAQYLGRASGAEFPIVSEPHTGPGLFIGRTQQAAAWELPPPPPTPEQDEGFVIRVDGSTQRAVLVGTIDMATKFAVYNFLDRFVGVRWYLPGKLFEVVPEHDRLTIPGCEMNELPALSGRTFGYSLEATMYPENEDEKEPQFGTHVVDYSESHAVRVDTSRRGEAAARWTCRNLLSVDSRLSASFHGHNFIRIFNYDSYMKEHPEYYPKRYSIEGAAPPGSFGWQPCTTEPGVFEVTLDWGRNFFEHNPEHWAWFSLGINDSGGWCGCDACTALDGDRGQFRGHPIVNDRYFKFVKQVADVMAREYPDRRLGLLAYNSTVVPPLSDETYTNLNVIVTRDSFQYFDPEYLATDLEQDRRWLKLTNGNVYRYDYYSFGWLVPRYYPHRLAEDIRRMRDMGIKGIQAEDVPLWPTIGPSYYVVSKLWWNPDRDVDELLNEFNTTLFGAAAPPMARYWDRHEQAWLKPRSGMWFEGLGNMNTQAEKFSLADLEYLDTQFKDAYRLAGDDELIRRRIRFFERGWRLAEYYIREYHMIKALEAEHEPDRLLAGARQLLTATAARHQYWAEYREEPRFEGDKTPCQDYRFVLEKLQHLAEWEQNHQAVLAGVAGKLAGKSPEHFNQLLEYCRAEQVKSEFLEAVDSAAVLALRGSVPNLVRNPGFELGDANQHPTGIDWVTKGMPNEWAVWKHITGSFSFGDGTARIHDSNSAVWIQTFPVEPGEELLASVEYKMPHDPPAKVVLMTIWKDRTGAWLGLYKTVGFNVDNAGRADDWREIFIRHRVPDGAVTAVYQFGALLLEPGQSVEFRKPYFGKLPKTE